MLVVVVVVRVRVVVVALVAVAVELVLVRVDRRVELAELVLVPRPALRRDDVVLLAAALDRRRLEGPLLRVAREAHVVERPVAERLDVDRHADEAVLGEERLARVGEDVLDERVEERALAARLGLVRVDVEVRHRDDGPRLVAGHVHERHLAEVGLGVRRHDRLVERLLGRHLDAARRDGRGDLLARAGPVAERRLAEAVADAVARVDVADGPGRRRDGRGHAARALDRLGARGPLDRRADVGLEPFVGAVLARRLEEVRRDALGRRRAERAVVDDDGLALGRREALVELDDGRVVPRRHAAAEDVREDARRHLDAVLGLVVVGDVVEERHGAERERHLEDLDVRALERLVLLLVERHVARAEVAVRHERARGVVLAHELELSRGRADRAVRHVDHGLGARLKERQNVPEVLGGVGGARAVEDDDVFVLGGRGRREEEREGELHGA
mmetsp:Transcript_36497/g.112925  ORF Transcript_36497/g.112925 Transcript_36497/m.112925 type:complete len:446 (+) Transcript_36497:702-2039(+)